MAMEFESRKVPFRAVRNLPWTRVFSALLALTVIGSMSYTLAANISLNSGGPVEFGQGVLQATACDSSVTVTPFSTFVNSNGGGEFKFSSANLSGISQACSGKDFILRAYNESSSSPLILYTTGGTTDYNSLRIHDEDGVFSLVNAGLLSDDITSTPSSFTVNLSTLGPPASVADASAQDVSRITIESVDGAGSGSLSFNENWIGYGSDPQFILGTGDFTIETWANISAHSPGGSIYDTGNSVNQPGGFAFWVEYDRLKYRINGYPDTGFDVSVPMVGSTPDVPDHNWYDTWHHYAVDRTGGIIRMFVDGALVASSYSNAGNVVDGTPFNLTRDTPYIGVLPGFVAGHYTLLGKIHSLRVTKGQALYLGTFTPPFNLEKTSNTLLLLKTSPDGSFSDRSDNNWQVTDTSRLPVWVGNQA